MDLPKQRAHRKTRGSGIHSLRSFRTVAGNAVSLLVDGAQAYPQMLDAIAGAEDSVVMESYAFAPDATGRRFLEALASKAREGVTVRVCIDGVGSLGTDEAFFRPLILAGGRLSVFHPPKPWLPSWGLWRRNHRKILVVDDHIGFIGGLNIADDYAPEEWGGRGWHDMHARVQGPAARELSKIANRTWRRMTAERWDSHLGAAVVAGNVDVQVLESRMNQRSTIRRAYLHAINQSASCVRIANPYFIPDQGVRRALRNACARGVRVQLLLAGTTDVPPVKYASRALYGRLMQWGVEIYEWTDRVLHAKTAVIDGLWCSIGSYNLDRRSLVHNFEANIACVDAALGEQLDAQFEADVGCSGRIDAETWHRRPPLEKLLEQLFFKLRMLL